MLKPAKVMNKKIWCSANTKYKVQKWLKMLIWQGIQRGSAPPIGTS
jgi:predicted DNA-binding protein (MmcQ/YjbR family)